MLFFILYIFLLNFCSYWTNCGEYYSMPIFYNNKCKWTIFHEKHNFMLHNNKCPKFSFLPMHIHFIEIALKSFKKITNQHIFHSGHGILAHKYSCMILQCLHKSDCFYTVMLDTRSHLQYSMCRYNLHCIHSP